MKKINLLKRYIKVGKFLHSVALVAVLLAFISFIRLLSIDFNLDSANWFFCLFILYTFSSMSILAELDGYSRFQNYKQVKDQIYLNGFNERFLRPLLRSSCQREAAVLAGEELGLKCEVQQYFKKHRYKWYHIIPDFVFKNPSYFFSRFFWRTTFFAPYYRAKISFDKLDEWEILKHSRTFTVS